MKSQYKKLLQKEIDEFQKMKKGESLLPKNLKINDRGKSLFL